jgi:hypothetical protein
MTGEGPYRGWAYADDAYGPAAALHAWILGHDVVLADHEGELTYIKEDFASFPYVTATSAGETALFLQVLIPSAAGTPPPDVQVLDAGSALAARIPAGDAADTVLMQRKSEPVTVGSIETDATFCWARIGDRVLQAALRDATYLRYHGESVIRAPEPITGAFDLRNPANPARLVADGDPDTIQIQTPPGL